MTETVSLASRILNAPFRFEVIPDEAGGFVIIYPDLLGCMTQVESLEEIPAAAREIRELWLESELQTNPDHVRELLQTPTG